MTNSSKPCKKEGCQLLGAFPFNAFCRFHWEQQIEENIKKYIDDFKKRDLI